MTQHRGVLYLHWGPDETVLNRSLRSLREVHPELPYHIAKLPADATLLDKAGMFALSPFRETLFLDADTVVLGRLDFGFAKAAKHGLACCICECPWARRFTGLGNRGDLVEYNTGLLFFTAAAEPVFRLWQQEAKTLDSSLVMVIPGSEKEPPRLGRMPLNDQASFARAVELSGFSPFVLPFNWNFRPAWQRSWWGPIKVWHDYAEPPAGLREFSQQQSAPGAIVQYRQL